VLCKFSLQGSKLKNAHPQVCAVKGNNLWFWSSTTVPFTSIPKPSAPIALKAIFEFTPLTSVPLSGKN
jgi:hypothetical protein